MAPRNEVMAAREGRKGVKGEFDWGNSREKDGVCHRCGRAGHVARRCVADMPGDVTAKYLVSSKLDAAAAAEDIIVLGSFTGSDDENNVAFLIDDRSFLSDSGSDSDPPTFHLDLSSTSGVQLQGVGADKTKKKARRGRRGRGGK